MIFIMYRRRAGDLLPPDAADGLLHLPDGGGHGVHPHRHAQDHPLRAAPARPRPARRPPGSLDSLIIIIIIIYII